MRQKRASVTDIARSAGVSIATVSRAMNQPALVQAETLARVRAAALELGYVPNRKAQALASGRSRVVGVNVPTLDSTIFAALLQTMQRTLYAEGYQLLVTSNEYDPTAEATALSQLIAHGVDALVVVGGARPATTLRMIEDSGLPLVQVLCGAPGHDTVGADNHAAGALIAGHLADLGHTRIGVIAGETHGNDRQRARLAGVRAALAVRGIRLDAGRVVETDQTIGDGRAAARMLMQIAPAPTAIIGTLDVLAVGAMMELRAEGLEVPEDVSVGGVDNIAFAAHIAPPLTTVDIPSSEIGAEAARLVIARLSGAEAGPPQDRALPVSLIVRASTAPLREGASDAA